MKFLTTLYISMILLHASCGYPQRDVQRAVPEDQEAEPSNTNSRADKEGSDDSDMYMEAMEPEATHVESQEPVQGSQNFYPTFTPFNNQPLGHSRPFYYQPEAAYSHRPTAYQQHVGFDSARISGYKGDIYEDRSSNENSILGSGNFGVLKGGTFYNDNDRDDDDYGYEGSYSSFYHNGHGRPSSFYYGSSNNHRPQQHEQFENFRDFADINTPSYSHFVIVYANKNGTVKEKVVENVEKKEMQPKNILEHLALLDLEPTTTTEGVLEKKSSKSKRKLALLLPEKKIRVVKQKATNRDLFEPLLALS